MGVVASSNSVAMSSISVAAGNAGNPNSKSAPEQQKQGRVYIGGIIGFVSAIHEMMIGKVDF